MRNFTPQTVFLFAYRSIFFLGNSSISSAHRVHGVLLPAAAVQAVVGGRDEEAGDGVDGGGGGGGGGRGGGGCRDDVDAAAAVVHQAEVDGAARAAINKQGDKMMIELAHLWDSGAGKSN